MDSDLLEPIAETAPETGGDFDELLTCIGALLYRWHGLEAVLVEEIRRLRKEGGDTGKNLVRVRGSLSERLAEWGALLGLRNRGNRQFAQTVAELSTQIERLRRTRDLVARNFAGATDGGDSGEPALFCGDNDLSPPTSEPRRITLTELRDILGQIDTCRERIPAIERR